MKNGMADVDMSKAAKRIGDSVDKHMVDAMQKKVLADEMLPGLQKAALARNIEMRCDNCRKINAEHMESAQNELERMQTVGGVLFVIGIFLGALAVVCLFWLKGKL